MNAYPVEAIRADYAALQELCYLNTGTVGIMSESILRNHLDRIAQYERFGHFGEADARCGYEDARREFARLINASTTEIALTRNASDGVNLVLSGLNLPRGSVLLTTDQEHPAVMLPLTVTARTAAGRVELVALDGSDDELLSRLNAAVENGDVAIAVLSHVSCETGRRLPIAEMCRICAENGVLTLVDGAQSVGPFAVDVRAIGCDFMTGNGHKWLCGPKGTGFLFVRQDRITDVTPRYIGDGAVDPSFNRQSFDPNANDPSWSFRPDAQRFEFGTRNWHLFGGLADSVQAIRGIGSTNIERHVAELSTYLKSELTRRPNLTVHTPTDWGASSGLVTFTADGWDGTTLSQKLWQEHSIIQRRVQIPNGVRISCAHYTSLADIERLLSVLDTIA